MEIIDLKSKSPLLASCPSARGEERNDLKTKRFKGTVRGGEGNGMKTNRIKGTVRGDEGNYLKIKRFKGTVRGGRRERYEDKKV